LRIDGQGGYCGQRGPRTTFTTREDMRGRSSGS
jgi:hypothetical protein